jgi:hypothetical protein
VLWLTPGNMKMTCDWPGHLYGDRWNWTRAFVVSMHAVFNAHDQFMLAASCRYSEPFYLPNGKLATAEEFP